MPEIKVLDSHVADLIAAGEVVERPASVAKELMENAIDAGATHITVEIEHGGLTFLRVTDDGAGIPADELPTAFLRHATSKLRTGRDLECIGTLGFRGEALAAISAVSRISIMSRTAADPMGASLVIEGGLPDVVEPSGCPLGTTMVVRDLFYNTPARLKFMKKDAAEGAAVFAAVQRIALSNPSVSVKFIRDSKQELLTPGDGILQSAVYAVLGRDLALGFTAVNGSGEGIEVSGFASLPACCRGSRNYQHFFVNGRYIKSRILMAAVEEAYRNQKMVGKFPGCVICLTMNPAALDVNVHPAKTEVKFGREREIFHAVHHAVLSALTADDTRKSVSLNKPTPHDTVTANQVTMNPTSVPLHSFSYVKPTGISPVLQKARESNLTPLSSTSAPNESLPTRTVPPVVSRVTPPIAVQPPQEPLLKKNTPTAVPLQPDISSKNSNPPASAAPVSAPPPTALKEPVPVATAADEPTPWQVVGEAFHTYIMVEQGDTLLFIDKHAAHERMNFDRMKAADYTPMVQTLLTPLAVKLPAEEREALLENQPLLEQFGFYTEDFGGSLLVRQAPFDVEADSIQDTLGEIAQTLLTTGRADPTAARDEVLHTMSCKAAIKGGWNTSRQELEHIAAAVMSGEVKYCPHGRPVSIVMSQYQLETQFGRA